MNIADRLVDAAIAQGPDSAPARLLREIVEAAKAAADAASTLDDVPPEVTMGGILAAYPEFGTLSDLVDRAWLVAS